MIGGEIARRRRRPLVPGRRLGRPHHLRRRRFIRRGLLLWLGRLLLVSLVARRTRLRKGGCSEERKRRCEQRQIHTIRDARKSVPH
jgi:hypothetical protein